MKVPLTLAVSDYDHVRDLTSGRIAVEGVDLTCLQLPVEEIFYRFTQFQEWHVSELSLAKYVTMLDTVAAIPVFPSRVFRHSAVFVARDGRVRSPEELAGARVGIPEWFQTAGVWARGILMHDHGLDLKDVHWHQAGLQQAGRRELRTPPLPITVVPDRTLTGMLLAGDLDAVITAHPPDPSGGRIVPLFTDAPAVERAWHDRTGIHPIMHVIALRRDILDRHPWLAANLLDAFTEARDRSLARARDLNASRFPIPWLQHYAASFGADPFPYGVGPNRHTLDTFLAYAHEQGITPARLRVDALFPRPVHTRYRI